ncbi:MAG: hypothetical protein PIR02_20095 [Microbacterium enclense]
MITGGVALVLDAPLRSATAATNGSDDVSGDDVLADKLRFFTEYPPSVLVRERLRAEFDLG